MKKVKYILPVICYFVLCTLLPATCWAQTNVPPPYVINTAGGSVKMAGGNYYGYNIGEPIVGTTGHYYTQGFLQPDYNIASGFNASVYIGNESCQGANDGYITVNAYNNKGPVHYKFIGAAGVDTVSSIGNLTPATYTLIISDSSNNSITKIVTIAASYNMCAVHVHNAFSPNGDGMNETFTIDGIEEYPNNKVYIFNRWGQQLWKTAGYNNTNQAWSGKDSKGDALYSGTYFYIIEIDGHKPLKGWVEITK